MKAVISDSLDALTSFKMGTCSSPRVLPGEVLIKVKACSLGYVDTLTALGRYQVKPELPFIPGREVSGLVEQVGVGVSEFKSGDRVFALATNGLAEFTTAPALLTARLPEETSFAAGSCLPLNYLTSLHALRDRAAVVSDETVLVFGAAGGTGSAAIQTAKHFGTRVVAAASTPEKRQFSLQQGADYAIDTAPQGWRSRLAEACGERGPDVVFDPVCGALIEPAFRSMSWRGRYLIIGFTGGSIPSLRCNLPLLKGASLVGVDARQYLERETASAADTLRTVGALAAQNKVIPAVHRVYAFDETISALSAAFSGKILGKTVVEIQ